MYPFGLKVRVKAITYPVYLTWTDEVDVTTPLSKPAYGKNISFTHSTQTQKLATKELRQITPRGHKIKVEGLELDQSHPVPQDKNRHRRLRRFKAHHEGVIVGWTWKAEGRFVPDDINFLLENRRQWGHQVALNNYQGTKHAWTNRIVFCLFDDLDPFAL